MGNIQKLGHLDEQQPGLTAGSMPVALTVSVWKCQGDSSVVGRSNRNQQHKRNSYTLSLLLLLLLHSLSVSLSLICVILLNLFVGQFHVKVGAHVILGLLDNVAPASNQHYI